MTDDYKILLLDSNSLINRAFHALPPLTLNDGTYTNAIYGYLNMLGKVLSEEKPTHVCAVFDAKAKTFRHQMAASYKATRKPMPEELAMQVPILQELLRKMGIKVLLKEGFEADDILGTLAKKFDHPTIIVSGDRDCLQLVSDTTTVFHTKKGLSEVVKYTPERLLEEGFTPEQIIEFKGLAGDSSDNISGCPGVGEKTAKELLFSYGSIDNIYANLESIKGKLKDKLQQNKDAVDLSKALATINVEVPLECTLDDLKYSYSLSEEAMEMFRYLQFKPALLEKFSKEPLKNISVSAVSTKTVSGPKINIEKNGDEKESEKTYKRKKIETALRQINDLSDLEQAVKSFTEGKPVVLDISKDKAILGQSDQFYSVEISHDLLGIGFNGEDVISILKPLFSARYKKILFDVKRTMHSLREYDETLSMPYDDILIMAYLNNNTKVIKNEAQLVDDYGFDSESPYCAFEEVFGVLVDKLKEKQLNDLYHKIELPLVEVLFDMENNGFTVDKNILSVLNAKFTEEIDALINEIYMMAGEQFNINSTKQLATILFTNLGLKPTKKTKTGYSVDADTLEELDHPIVTAILRYRELTKLKSTYIDGMKQVIDPTSGKVHTCFNQCITTTGRLSSTEPNLQNIPVRKSDGREIRKMFVPSPGCILVTADYSQIELRLLAHFSEEPRLVEEYMKDGDVHALTASKIFNVPLELVTKEMRSSAKAVNFGIIYGISVFGLAKNAKVSRLVAKNFIEQYFETYKKVKEYMDENVRLATKQGYLRSMCGRIRYFPELSAGTKFNIRAFGERAAMNMPLQGSASDIIKIAMIKVYNALKDNHMKAKLILQVHDELIVDTPIEEEAEVKKILKECMESAATLRVPLRVNVGSGENWYEAK